MPIVPFGQFLPDIPALGNQGIVAGRNCFATATGFAPVPEWSPSTDALTARPRGAIRARDSAGTAYSYAGDETKLYGNTAGSWSDVSSTTYTTGAEERWEFVRWGDKILAVNFSDNPQQITMGDANFAELTDAFQARHIAVVRNFVVVGNTFDSSDGVVADRIRWSAFNDETDWTPDPATLSDFTDLLTGGAVQSIKGGEFGVILQEESVRRLTFVGSPTVFQIDEVLPGVGLLAPGAAVRAGRIVYFLSPRGFIALTDGAQEERIGANRVDNFVLGDIDTTNLDRVSSVYDPVSGRVFWGYPGAGNAGGRPNRIIVYDTKIDRWSPPIEMEHELVWRSGGVSIDLDTDDPSNATADQVLDAVDITLDASRYKGSGQNIQIFDALFRTGALDSSETMPAMLQTGERELNDGANTHLNAFRPVIEGGVVTARIGTRQRLDETVTFSPSLNLRNGRFTRRANARYHTFRCEMSGAWSNAAGLQIARGDASAGERRA